jgi:hypothetical protein
MSTEDDRPRTVSSQQVCRPSPGSQQMLLRQHGMTLFRCHAFFLMNPLSAGAGVDAV